MLTLVADYFTKQNIVFPLAYGDDGATVRVAALTTDYLLTLTATGAEDKVTWTLFSAPAFLSIEPSADTLQASLKFISPSADTRTFLCYIQADDGQSKVKFPLAIEVREPFSFTVSGRSDNYQAYDSSASPVVFTGMGLHNLPVTDGTAQFCGPQNLPQGFLFTTSDGNTAKLEVAQPSSDSVSGGPAPSVPTSYEFKAFRPGSMYDSLDRAYTRSITVGTLSTKVGKLSQAVAYEWDNTNGYAKLNILTDYLQGVGSPLSYSWQVATSSGASGTVTDGGGVTQTFLEWTPSVAGNVTFILASKDASGNTLQLDTVGPVSVGLPGTNWTGSTGIKLLVDNSYKSTYAGQTLTFTLSMNAADIGSSETITVTPTISSVNGAPTVANPSAITLTQATTTATVSFTVPTTALFHDKWVIKFTATNNGSTRSGLVTAVVTSLGNIAFYLNHGATLCLAEATGDTFSGATLFSTKYDMTTLNGVTYSLVGAPAGLSIQNGGITGTALQVGTFTFQVRGQVAGYADSFIKAVLTVATDDKPLTILNFSPEVTSIQPSTQFHLYWGVTGDAKALTVQRNMEATQSVLGSVSTPEAINGTSVFALTGKDYRGAVYTKPVLVMASNTAGYTKLPNAPVVATIDGSNLLTMNWAPAAIDDAYGLYRGWNIQIKKDGGAAQQLLDASGNPPTGLSIASATNDSRIFTQQLQDGNYSLSMQALSASRNSILDADAWTSFRAFPDKVDSSTVFKDKATLKMKEALTLQLSSTYSGADFWRLTYSDGTSSDWLPVTSKVQSKAFSTSGVQSILVEFERVYSTSTDPVAKLRRSLTLSVFVQNELYNSAEVVTGESSTIGLGGEKGYEITSDSSQSLGKEPYEVITKALVVDDQTQELKLLVATSRNSNASSLLNTMAADVFSLPGRPHFKDLVAPKLNLLSDLALNSPVTITTTALPDGYMGQPLEDVQLLASGGVAPYDWYSDSLPLGLHLSLDGTLNGTPLQIGTYSVNFSVKDASQPPFIAETSVTMTVKSSVAIDIANVTAAKVGTYYQYQFTASGGLEPYTWSLSGGSLPKGLTLDPITGLATGYPVTYNSGADFDTPFSLTVEVVDAVGAHDSQVFKMNLLPMDLTLGNLDQTLVTQGGEYKLAIPVFGGRAPYGIVDFTSDGSIGNTLNILSPSAVGAVSDETGAGLTIVTGDHVYSPASYPYSVVMDLTAAGGLAPYTWSLDDSYTGQTTLVNATVTGSQLVGVIQADGKVTARVKVSDGAGSVCSKLITLTAAQNSQGSTYSLEYVTINKNNSTDIHNWTFTKINSLPDAKVATVYRPDASTYYGIAVWDPTGNQMYDLRTAGAQIQFKSLYSKVGGVGTNSASPLVLSARSSFWTLPTSSSGKKLYSKLTPASTEIDYQAVASGQMGILTSSSNQSSGSSQSWSGTGADNISQVLFSSNGALDAVGTPLPATWQMVNNNWIFVTPADLDTPSSGNWTWAIGSATTLPTGAQPTFCNPDSGATGSTLTTSQGSVQIVPAQADPSLFHPLAAAMASPYILEIKATDANGNTYSAQFKYYLVSGGSLRKVGSDWSQGSVLLWPDGTQVTYTSGFSVSSLGTQGIYQGAGTLYSPKAPTATNAPTVQAGGSSVTYCPIGVTYYQGDYQNRTTIQMTAGDTTAVTPTAGTSTTTTGANPYSFVILNEAGTTQLASQGGYTLGTVTTDNSLSKEMLVHCSATGGGNTAVVAVGVSPATLYVNATYDGSWNYVAMGQEWMYVLQATGGSAPYTFALASGTTLPGLSVHNSQSTKAMGLSGSYTGNFLTIYNSPALWNELIQDGSFTAGINITATDANGATSAVATIPVSVVVNNVKVVSPTTQMDVVSSTLTSGPFFIDAGAVDTANQGITVNTTATFTLDGNLPAGLSFRALSGSGVLNSTSQSLTANGLVLVGTPTGNPTTVSVNLTAKASGYSDLTIPVSLTTKLRTIQFPTLGHALPATHYSYAAGSPLVKVTLNGFSPNADHPTITTSLGTLSNPTIVNKVDYYPGVASYDLYYDFYSTQQGGVNLVLANAGSFSGASTSFYVMNESISAIGSSAAFTVSEYQVAPFGINSAPVTVTGGTAPYKVSALTVSDASHFYVQNGSVFLDMTKVTGGNTYQTTASYSVTDSSLTTLQSPVSASIQVRVLQENEMTVNYLSKTITLSDATATTINLPDLIRVQLGHAPFLYYLDAITFSDPSMADWFAGSPSGKVVVVNRTTQTRTYADYSSTDTITNQTGGGQSVTSSNGVVATGSSFSVPAAGTITSGTYTATLSLRVTDAASLSSTGTSTLTLIVP